MGGKNKRKENSKSQRKKKTNYQAVLVPLTEEE